MLLAEWMYIKAEKGVHEFLPLVSPHTSSVTEKGWRDTEEFFAKILMDGCCLKGCKEHHGQDEATNLSSDLFKERERCFLCEILTCMDKIAKSYESQAENSFTFISISFEDMAVLRIFFPE